MLYVNASDQYSLRTATQETVILDETPTATTVMISSHGKLSIVGHYTLAII